MGTLSFLSRLRGLPPLFLRISIGLAFFAFHGLGKVRPEGVWDWGSAFAAKDMAPTALLYLAAWTEFMGGFALLLGLFTRWAALGIACVMAYAAFVVNRGDPYLVRELAIAYLGGCLALACIGPGSVSLDRLFFGKNVLG